jgi:hypothetical protein
MTSDWQIEGKLLTYDSCLVYQNQIYFRSSFFTSILSTFTEKIIFLHLFIEFEDDGVKFISIYQLK